MYRVMEATLKAQETQTKEAIERARRAHEEGKVFLHKTLERRREKEAEKGRKEREELDKRMRAALSLKRNMESSEVRVKISVTSVCVCKQKIAIFLLQFTELRCQIY